MRKNRRRVELPISWIFLQNNSALELENYKCRFRQSRSWLISTSRTISDNTIQTYEP